MNSVPDAFLDDVCSQLDKCSLKCLKKTSRSWSLKAKIYRRKRRELAACMDVNDEGTEVGIGFEDRKSDEFISSALDARYDRIFEIYVGYREIEELPRKVSLEHARTNVPHLLRSLAFDCRLNFAPNKPFPQNLRNSILYGLHECIQLTRVYIVYSAEKVPEFVKHQISFGRLRRLSLNVQCERPDDLRASLRSFVKSPRVGQKFWNALSNALFEVFLAPLLIILVNFEIWPNTNVRPAPKINGLHRDLSTVFLHRYVPTMLSNATSSYMSISVNLEAILHHVIMMNSVPHAFLDAVCMQLDKWDLNNLKETSTRWSREATIHFNKRRDLAFYLGVNDDGTEIRIGVEDLEKYRFVSSALDAKYDRIKGIYIGHRELEELPEKISLDCFKKKFRPVLRSLVFGCTFCFNPNSTFPQPLTDCIFSGLRECSQFTHIYIGNEGTCAEFVKNQISLGSVRLLSLCVEYERPDSLQASLKSFLESPNFEALDLRRSNLKVDFDMVNSLVERFVKGHNIYRLQGKPSFPVSWLYDLYVDEQQMGKDGRPDNRITHWTRSNKRLIASMNSDGELYFDLRKCWTIT
uniref:F-box domain-containing protein n=1 Tax=Steinernema glaseri TaxID=37863 RepID=A0A1I7YIF1_9BILA